MGVLRNLLSRRQFLRWSGLAGTGLLGTGLLGTGLLGAGFAGESPAGLLTDGGGIRAAQNTGGGPEHAARGVCQRTRLLMGTIVTMTVASDERAKAGEALERAFEEMRRLVGVFDRRDSRSALFALNDAGHLAGPPPELLAVLEAARLLSRETEQAFNPAIAPVVDLFEKSAANAPPPGGKALAEALALARPGEIRLEARAARLERAGMKLTLDGIAKGYIADAASARLLADGFLDHLVNAGGDIRVSGVSAKGRPWVVGIEDPARDGALLDAVALERGGLATSGGYERYYDAARTRHHLVDHRSGRSPAVASVSVRAATAMRADALATALALMSPAKALAYAKKLPGVDCLILAADGRRFVSRGWVSRL